jgi:hypothetical protein
MNNSRWHRWKRNEREQLRKRTPLGRFVKDLPDWQISAKKAQSRAKKA